MPRGAWEKAILAPAPACPMQRRNWARSRTFDEMAESLEQQAGSQLTVLQDKE